MHADRRLLGHHQFLSRRVGDKLIAKVTYISRNEIPSNYIAFKPCTTGYSGWSGGVYTQGFFDDSIKVRKCMQRDERDVFFRLESALELLP